MRSIFFPLNLLEIFATLSNHINYLHPNIEDTTILYSYHIPPLIPFLDINDTSILVERSNFTLVFFKDACHANPRAKRILHGQFHIF